MALVNKAFWFGHTWMVRRDSDGKVAIACDIDVTAGTPTEEAVVEDTEEYWFPNAHEAVHAAGIECSVPGCFK